MKEDYAPHLEIDRIDNNKGYSKENCQWATRKQQTNNHRRNRRLTHGGITLTMAQWAERLGVPADRIKDRLKLGWSVSGALTAPKYHRKI